MKKMSLLVITVITVITTISAQNGEPVSDSSWIEKTGNLFYGVRLSVYADGAESRTKTLIGDTAALVTAMKDRLTSKSATMAVDVRYVSTYRKAFTGLIRESNDVLAMTGIDPQKQVQDEYAAPFLITGWTIKREGTTDPVEFTVNAQGNLRYSVNGDESGPTARQCAAPEKLPGHRHRYRPVPPAKRRLGRCYPPDHPATSEQRRPGEPQRGACACRSGNENEIEKRKIKNDD